LNIAILPDKKKSFDICRIMYNLWPKLMIYSIDKEIIMLQVTEKANEMISSFLKDREDPSCIRIYLMQGG